MNSIDEEIRLIYKEKIIAWRKDPLLFVKDNFIKGFNLEGIDGPTKQQEEILRAIAPEGARVAVKSGHGVGKSAVAAWIAIWFMFLIPGGKGIATAPSSSQLKDVLMPEIRKWLNYSTSTIKKLLICESMRLYRADNKSQFLSARTSRKGETSSMQGIHSPDGVLIIGDEFFGIEEEVFQTLKGAMTHKNARALMLGNPTRLEGYAYDAFHVNKKSWSLHTLSCLNSPLVSEEYIEEQKRTYGEDSDIYKVRVLGEFPDHSIDHLFTELMIEESNKRILLHDQVYFESVIFGIDVSYFGSSRSVLSCRQGPNVQILEVRENIEPMTFTDLIIYHKAKLRPDAMFIDPIGVGSGVVSRLRQLKYDPIPINFSSPSSTVGYFNKRAECYGKFKEWMKEGGHIPESTLLKKELMMIKYGYSKKNSDLQIISKSDIVKNNGGMSPDIADSIALTFSQEVSRNARGRNKGPRIITNYKIFR